MENIETAIHELHKGFAGLNKALFENQLPEPAILIQNQGNKKDVLGWCSTSEIWSDQAGANKRHEITITAEYMDRSVLEIMETMLHEMIHLFCSVNGIKDTSRGTAYHNKKFKEMAEAHGLICEKDSKIGWAITSPAEDTKKLINSMELNEDAFKISRMFLTGSGKGGPKKQSMKKLVCECGNIIRCTKEVNVKCLDCGEKFEEE